MKASMISHRKHGLAALVAASGLAMALLVAPVSAQAAGKLELKTESFKDVEKTGADGKKVVVRQAITKAVPGEEIIYVITYHNDSAAAVDDVKVDNPVPKGLVYKVGSAEGAGTRIEFSVDGGKHFGALDTLKVSAADGSTHIAQGADVTNVRWTLTTPLKAGASGAVSYRALLP